MNTLFEELCGFSLGMSCPALAIDWTPPARCKTKYLFSFKKQEGQDGGKSEEKKSTAASGGGYAAKTVAGRPCSTVAYARCGACRDSLAVGLHKAIENNGS